MLHKIPIEKPLVFIQPEQPPDVIFWASNVQCNLCAPFEIESGNKYGFSSDAHYGCAEKFFRQNGRVADEVFFCECSRCYISEQTYDINGNRLGREQKVIHYFGSHYTDDEVYVCPDCEADNHPIVPSWLVIKSRFPDAA